MNKTILLLILSTIMLRLEATNYYISSSSGNDTNSGTSIKAPWQSLSKLNTVSKSINPGDSILFKCNDTIAGKLFLSKSGTAAQNIYIGSYGTGNRPIVSALTKVNNWKQTSSNIWQATCENCTKDVSNFFINSITQQIGRWPNVTDTNKGYRTYNAHVGLNEIIDSTLSDTINWTGAEAVVHRTRWILDRLPIKAQNKDSLLFSQSISYAFLDGFGYFIQNDPRTLDQQGEWYFNAANKTVSLYSTVNPNNLFTQSIAYDTLLSLTNCSFITVANIQFDGAGQIAIYGYNANKVTFINDAVTNAGTNAVVFNNSNGLLFDGNFITNAHNNGISFTNCNGFTLQNNIIKNIALVAGMGLGADGQYFAINVAGNNYAIHNNRIDSAGYIALSFNGDSLLIQNNVISHYCMTKDDGGGIYTYGAGLPICYSRKVVGNIVYSPVGAQAGSGWIGSASEGLYMDDGTPNVDLIGNTIFNCSDNGIVIHNANHISVKGNNVYNCANEITMGHDSIQPKDTITWCVVDSNEFVSKFAYQSIGYFHTIDNGISKQGTFDYNHYCRPLDDSLIITVGYFNGVNVTETHTLESWSKEYNRDVHSGKSPIKVPAYVVDSVTSSNYITNGTFASNTNGWYVWANYNNGVMTFDPTAGVTNGALHATFTSASGHSDGYMILVSNNFAFSTSKTYRLRFAAKSTVANTSLQIIPRKNGAPYNLDAVQKIYAIDTVYRQFEYVFTPSLNEPNARIDFQMTEGQGDIWLDNVELVTVDATQTNPDDYLLFAYNPTKMDSTITFAQSYVDVKGIPVSSPITLKPFSSIILFKKVCNGIIPAMPDSIIGKTIITADSTYTYSIAAVDGANYYTWTLPSGWTGTSLTNTITAIAGTAGGSIMVTANNVCDSSAARTLTIAEQTNGIKQTAIAHGITLYPNPTDGKIWVNVAHSGTGMIAVYNNSGQIVYETSIQSFPSTLEIDLSHYAKGMYVVKVIVGTIVMEQKLLIQ